MVPGNRDHNHNSVILTSESIKDDPIDFFLAGESLLWSPSEGHQARGDCSAIAPTSYATPQMKPTQAIKIEPGSDDGSFATPRVMAATAIKTEPGSCVGATSFAAPQMVPTHAIKTEPGSYVGHATLHHLDPRNIDLFASVPPKAELVQPKDEPTRRGRKPGKIDASSQPKDRQHYIEYLRHYRKTKKEEKKGLEVSLKELTEKNKRLQEESEAIEARIAAATEENASLIEGETDLLKFCEMLQVMKNSPEILRIEIGPDGKPRLHIV